MSTYIVPGTKLTSLSTLSTYTAGDFFYVVDGESSVSYKTEYSSLTSNILNSLLSPNDTRYIQASGDTFTGNLTALTGANLYVFGDNSCFIYLSSDLSEGSKAASKSYVDAAVISVSSVSPAYVFSNFVAITGSTITGNISTSLTPTTTAELVNKLYVDGKFMPLSGGTFTGGVSAATPSVGDPSTTIATVGYVESRIAAQPGSRLNPLSAFIINGNDNNGRGNTSVNVTFINDNDRKIRTSGIYGSKQNGGMGFYQNAYGNFPQIPVSFVTGLTSEYVTNICTTGLTTLLLTNQGYVYSAGDNTAGQLGLGDTTRRNTFTVIPSGSGPTTSPLSGIGSLTISLGNDSAATNCSVYAISGGNLWAWGSNKAGQLGTGDLVNTKTPLLINNVPSPGSIAGVSLRKITASNSDKLGYALAIDTANGVHVVGWNGAGQLGLSASITGTGNNQALGKPPTNTVTFRESPLWALSSVLVNPKKSVTLPVMVAEQMTADDVYTSGSTSYILTGGNVWACGNNSRGACGNGTFLGVQGFKTLQTYWTPVSSSTETLSGVQYITTNGDPTGNGNVSVCAVLSSKEIRVWGNNGNGALGTGDNQNKALATTPVPNIFGVEKAKMVGIGTNATLFVLTSGGDIYVSGFVKGGIDGRGEGDVEKQNTLQKVIRPQGVFWTDFDVFSYGQNGVNKTVLVKSSTNELYAWGYNLYGQTGIPNAGAANLNPEIIDVPIRVSLF